MFTFFGYIACGIVVLLCVMGLLSLIALGIQGLSNPNEPDTERHIHIKITVERDDEHAGQT